MNQAAFATNLTIRRLQIDLSNGFSRRWNGGDAFRTAFANALSMSFPVGEQAFIDAVRNGAKVLADTPENEDLKRHVKGFIGQEATHRQIHNLFNAQLEKQGLVNNWGPRAEVRLKKMREKLSKKSNKAYLHELAITAAFEHCTSIFGDLTLERVDQVGYWFAGAEEPLKTLWQWHAAEESEHKCVAFDLYQRLDGNYKWRIRWFWFAIFLFATDAFRQTVNNLWHDKALFKPSTWWSASKFLFGRNGLIWILPKLLWKYMEKDFHPIQIGHPTKATDWLITHSDQWSAVGERKA